VRIRTAFCFGLLLVAGALSEAGTAKESPVEQSLSAEALFNRGNAYRQRYLRARTMSEPSSQAQARPDDELALENYTAAIRLKPDFAAAYVNRAAVHYERGEYAAAIADCDAAIRIDPRLAEAYNNRSLAYYKSDDYAKAKADFDQTIKLEQFYGNAMIMRTLPDIEVPPPSVK
jgi:tetratricopeptide (TPR) repeat protein